MSWSPRFEAQPDEEVWLDLQPPRSILWPAIIITLGMAESLRRLTRWVITDRRVVVFSGLPGMRRQQGIPLDRIQDAVVQQQLWVAHVLLTSAGGRAGVQKIGPMRPSDARAFAEAALTRSPTPTSG